MNASTVLVVALTTVNPVIDPRWPVDQRPPPGAPDDVQLAICYDNDAKVDSCGSQAHRFCKPKGVVTWRVDVGDNANGRPVRLWYTCSKVEARP